MRTGARASGAPVIFDTQIAFGRLADRFEVFTEHEISARIANVDHADRFIRAVIGARFAADAGDRINDDAARKRFAVDGAGGTADHTYGVGAMHAGIGDHDAAAGRTVPEKAGIVVVSRGASPDAVVATSASVEIDDHRGGSVEEAVGGEKFKRVGTNPICRRPSRILGNGFEGFLSARKGRW